MNSTSFPLLPHLLVFILGIHLSFQITPIFIVLDLCLALGLLFFFSFQSPLFKRNLIIGPCFLMLGYGLGKLDENLPANHYSQYLHTNHDNTFEFELEQRLHPTKFYQRYYIQLKKCNEEKASGRLLLQIKKDTTQEGLDYAKQWKISGKLNPLSPPLNPGQFDYSKYLKTIGIYHQLKSGQNPTPLGNKKANLLLQSKAYAIKAIEKSNFQKPVKQLFNALLLGNKTTLDREALEEYARAGLAHLLAISGLHIGLLMLLFHWCLQPLTFLPKGKILRSLGVLALLWSYAFFVGGSPSVIRAVTLFSAVQLGRTFQRKLPTAYLVLLSMAILLFISPRLMLHLGFQLSYLAVFGILFIQPIFQIKSRFAPLNWFWNLTTVSLAAQIAVAPLSIFHFQQFPGLFLLSNWVILPFIGWFLYLGFGSLIWLIFAPLPNEIVLVINSSVKYMNVFVQWINQQEDFLFSNVFIDTPTLLLSYALLASLLLWYYTKKSHWFYWNGVVIIGLLYVLFIRNEPEGKSLWLAYDRGTSILVEQKNDQLLFYTSDTLQKDSYVVRQYQKYFGIKKITHKRLENVYRIGNDQLFVVDEDWIQDIEKGEAPYILLHNNPKFNLARYLKHHQPKIVLIDGSNTPFYIKRWKQTLMKEKIPFHITAEKGAFSFNLENAE